jgi:hypothetical protein
MTTGQYLLLLIFVVVASAGYIGYKLDGVAIEIRRFRRRLLGGPGRSSEDGSSAPEILRLFRRYQSSPEKSTETLTREKTSPR